MALLQVAQFRVTPGKTQELNGNVAKAKKIHERLGGKVRVWQSVIGGQPMSLGYVIEHASWTAFGTFGEKMQQDTEWQSFWADAVAHPSADLLQNSVLSEL
jgi:hypothetical protein